MISAKLRAADSFQSVQSSLRSVSWPGFLALVCLVLSGFISPLWLDWWELLGRDVGISYEGTLRVHLGLSLGLALLGSRLCCWPGWNLFGRLAWRAVLVTSLFLAIIFVFDWTARLDQEDSWIRYPTAIALFFAAGGTLRLALKAGNKRSQKLIWLTLCSGFILGGADELLEIHETLGRMIQIFPHARTYNDLITLSYSVIGAGVLVALLLAITKDRPFKPGQKSSGPDNLQGVLSRYLAAMIVFASSQVFDTFDIFVHGGLQVLAGSLANRGHTFPEFWYILYQPRQFMNSLEEVLECLAAALILATTLHALRCQSAGASIHSPQPSTWRPAVLKGGTVFLILVTVLTLVGWPSATAVSPLKGANAGVLAGSGPQLCPISHQMLPNGEVRLAEDSGCEYEPAAASLLGRARLRRMHRNLCNVGSDSGRLYFVTGGESKSALLPTMRWRLLEGVDE